MTRTNRIVALAAVALLSFGLAGCAPASDASNSNASNSKESSEPVETVEPVELPDLAGEWVQANPNSPENYQAATITDGTMEVLWVSDGGDTKSLYWAGTYVAPTTADEPYAWDSENDTAKTDGAMLASGDPTKTFTYEDGVISYEVSALGTTTTVKLEREGE